VNLNTLRFRLIWTHSVVIALVVVCIGLIRHQITSYRSQLRLDTELFTDAHAFVSHFHYDRSGFALSTEGLSTANALAIQELEHYFIITDLQGHVLNEDLHNRLIRAMLYSGELSAILRQKNGFAKATAEDGSAYRFISLSMPPGVFPQPAIMHIGRSMEVQKGILRSYLVFYLYSVPVILVVSVAVGWFLAGRALRPFEEITRTAEKITDENLNTQIYTERKEEEIQRLVQAFNAMVKRLDESFQRMRKFNADAAHELRTPLAILQGETEVALRSPDLPDEIRSVLASNLEELDRLTRIVNDLLTLSEAEAGIQVLIKEPVDLKTLIEDLVDQMRLLTSDRNLSIDTQSVPELWIDADKLWIRRAIVNLLHNAIKYSRDGGTIVISAGMEKSRVRLSIRDYGIGILPQDLPHIFGRLYRADPARSRDSGGVGLGLALVKWIIEAHKGSIRVESVAGQGSLFEILLPSAAETKSVSGREDQNAGTG
jgi:heavy metal sensor kinase